MSTVRGELDEAKLDGFFSREAYLIKSAFRFSFFESLHKNCRIPASLEARETKNNQNGQQIPYSKNCCKADATLLFLTASLTMIFVTASVLTPRFGWYVCFIFRIVVQ